MYPKVFLKKGKERSIYNYHPWIFSGAINRQDEACREGALVEVYSSEQAYLCTGHFHHGSITVRIISFTKTPINADFWLQKLTQAYRLRQRIHLAGSTETTVYRLCHGEGDGLPGLIIDIYNHTAVIQAHTLGMHEARHAICSGLQSVYGDNLKAVYDKSGESLSKSGEIKVENGYLFGNKQETTVKENGFIFSVDWERGQKTGFFIDQRESRNLLRQYTHNKKVLNTFAYSGGFSVYALENAQLVDSVDSSEKAMEKTAENVLYNGTDSNHRCFTIDVFDYLKHTEEVYDVVVLDPPAFAKHLSSVNRAVVGYRNLNYEAIKRIKPNGILFTFSCSQVIDKAMFNKIIFMASAQARRQVKILHRLSQPADHPVSIFHPEGEYLKGLVLFVE